MYVCMYVWLPIPFSAFTRLVGWVSEGTGPVKTGANYPKGIFRNQKKKKKKKKKKAGEENRRATKTGLPENDR